MQRIILGLVTAVAISTTAEAQVVVAGPDPVYLAVTTPTCAGGLGGATHCINPDNGIPLNYFATAATVNALGGRIDAAFAATTAAFNTQVAALNTQVAALNRDVSRSFEIGAIAASMRDAIPNTGDRFAIRLNAAGFQGYAGGSVGVSMNLTDSVRLSANYGRGATQNVVSGGVNISFR